MQTFAPTGPVSTDLICPLPSGPSIPTGGTREATAIPVRKHRPGVIIGKLRKVKVMSANAARPSRRAGKAQ